MKLACYRSLRLLMRLCRLMCGKAVPPGSARGRMFIAPNDSKIHALNYERNVMLSSFRP